MKASKALLEKFNNIRPHSEILVNGTRSRNKRSGAVTNGATEKASPNGVVTVKGGYLATIELRDLHAGRQVIDEREWSLETWSRVCRNSVIDTCDLLSRIGNVDMILLVTGDDLIHFDTDAMTTTGGTRVEGHSSIPRIY